VTTGSCGLFVPDQSFASHPSELRRASRAPDDSDRLLEGAGKYWFGCWQANTLAESAPPHAISGMVSPAQKYFAAKCCAAGDQLLDYRVRIFPKKFWPAPPPLLFQSNSEAVARLRGRFPSGREEKLFEVYGEWNGDNRRSVTMRCPMTAVLNLEDLTFKSQADSELIAPAPLTETDGLALTTLI